MVGALGSALVGVAFALLFHLVNFAIGLFSPTIHALRLHYVEFFGEFYSPGGAAYRPLAHWRPASRSATGMRPPRHDRSHTVRELPQRRSHSRTSMPAQRRKTMDLIWIVFASAAAVAITGLATAWAQGRIGPAVAASLAEKPELATTAIIMVAIPETMVILGFVVAVMILLRAGG